MSEQTYLKLNASNNSDTTDVATYTYDALYRQVTVADLMSNTTSYSYDSVGRLIEVDYPGGGSDKTQFTSFDAYGRLLSRLDGNGQETDYTYDATTALLTDKTYVGLSADSVHYKYDAHGRRSEMDDPTGVVTYTYDDIDNLTEVDTTFGSYGTQSLIYSYYASGQRSTMESPVDILNYSYDGARRWTGLQCDYLGTTSWDYQDNNWLSIQTLPSGTTSTHEYNARGLETSRIHTDSTTHYDFAEFHDMTYDGNGDRTEFVVASDAYPHLDGTTDFTYDSREQLTQEASTRGPSYTYNNTYTHSSNPTTNPWTFRGSSRTYNSNNQITNTGYSYDYNGNPTTYKSDTLVFDEENRLNNYRTSPGVTYGYNGDGLRAWKQVGTDIYYYLYDGEQLVCEYKIVSGDLHLQNFYTWGADGLFNKVTPDDTSQIFYLYDPQGSVAVQIDDSEDEQNYSIFDAWGNLTEGTVNNIGYNGKYGYYSDSDTGLVLCTHRYYDPTNGKWLTRDPIGYRGGFNLYGYVGNDVENRVDPEGLKRKRHAPPTPGSFQGQQEIWYIGRIAITEKDCTDIHNSCFYWSTEAHSQRTAKLKADFEEWQTYFNEAVDAVDKIRGKRTRTDQFIEDMAANDARYSSELKICDQVFKNCLSHVR